ncbi:MAG: glycoside hydrolase family 3 N-terminal domain-containing protein [candidate division Zixibacteria bacterium]|nr:glycoside hydrolase family 3 N-terminal domain-containing protein [candidate division Zixibacteria bacterium]
MSDLLKQIGQLFIIGFTGEEPSQEFLDFLKEKQISGVILFEENCPSYNKTRENIARIRAACGDNPPFIAIDQEGGRVCRLRGVPAEFRSAEEYGQDGNVDWFRKDYLRSVLLLESIGINLNFAPVCDIFTNPKNTCLAGRCFGKSHREVQPFVEAAVETSKNAGVMSCLKHFPGLGASTIDPHHETATADYEELIWTNRERIPFAAGVKAGADIIMTTHLLLPAMDNTIVTGSKKIVESLIRDALAFDGPVITDDLSMTGAAVLGAIGPRTVAAFNAGHDLLLFDSDFELASRAYNYFCDSLQRGEINEKRLQEAMNRISGIKFKLDSSVLH